MDRFLFSFGITENLQNFNNTPDIGVQLGVAYIPARVERARYSNPQTATPASVPIVPPGSSPARPTT